MIDGRYYNGRKATQEEIETVLKIIDETEFDATIEDGCLMLEVMGEDDTYHIVGQCDLRRLVAQCCAKFYEGCEWDRLALAGLLSKCAEIVLSHTEPYQNSEDMFQGSGRLFSSQNSKNLDEEEQPG